RRRFSGTRENPHGIPFKRFLVLLSFFVHPSQQSANTQTHLCCSKAAILWHQRKPPRDSV
ncbi:hypothetical protein R0K18_06775, partial [Pantoea sp. SIMBA_133]